MNGKAKEWKNYSLKTWGRSRTTTKTITVTTKVITMTISLQAHSGKKWQRWKKPVFHKSAAFVTY
jgi:hypothetical protein